MRRTSNQQLDPCSLFKTRVLSLHFNRCKPNLAHRLQKWFNKIDRKMLKGLPSSKSWTWVLFERIVFMSKICQSAPQSL